MEAKTESGWTAFSVHIIRGLDQICKRNAKCSRRVQIFLSKQIWSPSDRQAVLNALAQLFVEFSCTEDICWSFRCIILDIIYRAERLSSEKTICPKQHLCIAISKALCACPSLKGLALEFLEKYGLFSARPEAAEPVRKKRKKETHSEKVLDLEICQAAWRFSRHAVNYSKLPLFLEHVLPYLNHQHKDIRWFAFLTVTELIGMSPAQREALKQQLFSSEDSTDLTIRHNEMEVPASPVTKVMGSVCEVQAQTSCEKYTKQCLTAEDLGPGVVSVNGVLLTRLSPPDLNDSDPDRLVMTPSTLSNLRSLALAVASSKPVLLQGPVGCGKTSLVEYLAKLTGRDRPPAFIKLQLGDQTDSKALLGTYRCTDVPGEFVWQPGVLTQAVMGGHWLLLEDVDYAPMDVLSVLLPLLENNTLSLPGHGDNLHAAPGFQIFFTQRLLQGVTGWHSQAGYNCVVLEKLWRQINVEPLSKTELQQVVVSCYPQLSTVVDRLLDIYFLLSPGSHDLSSEHIDIDEDTENVGKFLSHEGRLISTRDLMNWCRRIADKFDVKSPESGAMVFQNALDCFCACISQPEKRTSIAVVIAAKLNITRVKAEFYCSKYKPNVEIKPDCFSVGRVSLPKQTEPQVSVIRSSRSSFAFTRQSTVLLERVAVCVADREPVLLVGETGTGKTSSVQFLARQLGHQLKVINMNQQSDSSDLLGGFKPIDVRHVVRPFKEDFELLFCKTFSRKQNIKFLQHVQDCFVKRKWADLFSLLEHTQTAGVKKSESEAALHKEWIDLKEKLHRLRLQVTQTEKALAFAFIEGTLVKAIRQGDWVLLDEINLATAETLECLSGLLESTCGSVLLTERGDTEPIVRHDNFRLFACMNPATDVGKKDLPMGIRNRFTELYVDEVESVSDLSVLTAEYLKGLSLSSSQIDGIVKFYLTVRKEADKRLNDGTGHRPHFSLRTLCRALRYAAKNSCVQVSRSLYEGFCLSFLTQLNRSSHPIVEQLVCQLILGKTNIKSILKQGLPEPPGGKHVNIEGYWLPVGGVPPHIPENYILTPSVRKNLKDLARIVSAGQQPVLLQGETSVGKTSLVTWLAQATGYHCVRVNNHEHTDLQEYIGSYTADEQGKLMFKEGVLVDAMRKGHWIILDELNLAPSDVLEALNRLLDDNRELFIPETQETVRAHRKFMLFATQNPPGHYGGRKMLSRAFRNRFIELHFDEIPSKELETILHKRCDLPLSYGKKLVAVMLDLQVRRRGSSLFAGKQGFMTLRDLFRWASRYHSSDDVTKARFYDWDQHMADHGYMLLAGRVRKPEEERLVQEVIQKHLKREVHPDGLFTLSDKTSTTTASMLKDLIGQTAAGFENIVWTYNMRRLAVLVGQAVRYKEPILLVGDTGCGKTTVCQFLTALQSSSLHTVNCHMHSESADFLGGLRPVRSHINEDDHRLFEWVDGPLVLAMRQGHMFLIDEISLADDSVLERLNSVLEPERSLLLAEKGGGDGPMTDVEQITAQAGFQVFATMNPGGDYGKKELSPALRNRFTELWCPQVSGREDLISIIEHNLHAGLQLCNQEDCTTGIGRAMVDFVTWFTSKDLGKRCTVSIRDYLSWVNFMNTCGKVQEDNDEEDCTGNGGCGGRLEPAVAYIHGACLVFLDGLGSGLTSRSSDQSPTLARQQCLQYLTTQVNSLTGVDFNLTSLGLLDKSVLPNNTSVLSDSHSFSIPPFSVTKGPVLTEGDIHYTLLAPTPCVNGQRILRALQLPRPLLLEGSPGVGKTSLVTALAKASGRELVRINLSEQTDVTDLFGADLPVEGAEGGVFAWRDGPLLRALKDGHWIVLDELNLASQSVLEGLNACLDHRAEVYIPELGRTFRIQHEKTRIFACQNPLNQGGGRKGLPRSFLNRFTQVYIEPLSETDLLFITSTMYPIIPQHLVSQMVGFNQKLQQEVMVDGGWGQRGAPWEFNLRDIFRWCDLVVHDQVADQFDIGQFVNLLYRDRMRTEADKEKVLQLFQSACPELSSPYYPGGAVKISPHHIQINQSFLQRKWHQHALANQNDSPLFLLHRTLAPLEALMKCVEMNWMPILVGGQSSGKTSLVKLLSQLTGSTLHVLAMNSAMDTTELLGGFEQADIARHIQEAAKNVEEILRQFCIKSLLEKFSATETTTICKLWAAWGKYVSMATAGLQSSSTTEVEQMKNQVKHLISTCEILEQFILSDSVEAADKLAACKTQLGKLRKGFNNHSKHRGGTFEWVDSLLVRSLQIGDWLLIDNVNFCSASVLDRLNALLEPNGVLSVSERGVIDGQVPVIKPHPNFRLFLAMDPKFGEISRAMRNRGVEIYVLGEGEGGCYNNLDTKTVLHGIGISGKLITDWLISLHENLREALIGRDKPTVQQLFNVAMIVKEKLNRGVPMGKALKSSSLDVYVQSLKSTATRKRALQVVKDKFTSLESEVSIDDDCMELGLSPVPPITVQDYIQDCTLASTMKHATVMVYAWDKLHLLCKARHEANTEDIGLEIRELLNLLKHGTALFIEQMASENWRFSLAWLKTFTEKSKSCQKAVREWLSSHGCIDTETLVIVTQLMSCAEKIVNALFTCDVAREWEKLIEKFNPECKQILQTEPFDPRMNPQCLVMMSRQLCREQGKQRAEDVNSAIEILHNRLFLLQFLVQRQTVEDFWMSNINPKDKSPLGLSLIYHQGTKGWTSLQHPALPHLYPLMMRMYTYLQSALPDMPDLTDCRLQQILLALRWFFHLIKFSKKPTQRSINDVLPQLHLHWNWFYSKTLPVLGESCKSQMPAELQTVLTTLNNILGQDNTRSKLFLKLWREYGHPDPPRSQKEAELHVCLRHVCNLITNPSPIRAGQCLKETVVTAIRTFMGLFEGFMTKVSGDYDALEIELENIKALLLYSDGNRDEPMAVEETAEHPIQPLVHSASTNEMKQRCLPLFDLVALMTQQYFCGQILEEDVTLEGLDDFINFSVQHGRPNPVLLSLLKLIDLTKEKEMKRCLIIPSLLISHDALWTGSLGKGPVTYVQQGQADMEMGSNSNTSLRNKGPGKLQLSPFTHIAFHLIQPDVDLRTTPPQPSASQLLAVNIPLGQFSESQRALQEVHQLLWLHSAAVSSPVWDFLTVERRKVVLLFCQLLESLQTLLNEEMSDVWTSCVQDLKMAENDKPFTEKESLTEVLESSLLPKLGDSMMGILRECLESISELFPLSDHIPLVAVGTAWVKVGLLQSLLLGPVGPVDPVVKQKIKLQYIVQELEEIENELSVRDLNQWVMTGTKLDDSRLDLLHPRIQMMCARRKQLKGQQLDLEQQQAYRPDSCKFSSLLQEITSYQRTTGDPAFILSLLQKFHSLTNSGPDSSSSTPRCFNEERVWQSSLQKFLLSLMENYPNYNDLLDPFLLGINLMKHGMRMVSQSVSVHHKRALLASRLPPSFLLTVPSWLEDILVTLGKFPSISRATPDLITLVQNLSSHHLLQAVKFVTEDDQDMSDFNRNSSDASSRILLSSLQFLHEHALCCGSLPTEVLKSLSHILSIFVTMWREREDSWKAKEEEESSLYRYKSLSFGDDLTEDEKDEREFRSSFPHYEEDFVDVVEKTELGDGPKPASENPDTFVDDFSESSLSDQEMVEVWQAHQTIFTCLTHSDWLPKLPIPTVHDHDLKPVLSCNQVAAMMGRKSVEKIYYGMDKEFIGGHLVILSAAQQSASPDQKIDSCYDIYHDSNVPEVLKCRPLLERFLSRVRQLQTDWPDHPTLKQLSTIAERILGFSVTCPLMKFLAGLELLVQKSQDWESNAARFVSMATQIHEVTEMILEWRKLELSCWNKSLDTVYMKAQQKAHKWWFHLYQLVGSVLHDQTDLRDQTDLPVQQEAGEKKTDKEVISTLTQFLESSPLGEFSVRLEMLYGFCCQLVHEEPSQKQAWMLNVVWNLYQFYHQFLPLITEELSKQRSPIEKELKGFVKIARWNDLNYWALKQTTEKTHRTIHKHMKAFQTVLSQPIKNLLTEDTNVSPMTANEEWILNMNGFLGEIKTSITKFSQLEVCLSLPQADQLPLQSHLSTLCRRMITHCSKLTSSTEYVQDVITLDEFTGEVIEAIQDLQSLEVNKEADKEKQKSEAKSINLRKRKALSDLYKTLVELGLSYRKGLTLNAEGLQTASLLVPPVNIAVQKEKCGSAVNGLGKLWEGCTHYYFRCVSRRSQFLRALETPSQELGVANIDRCRGFAEQMMSILIDKQGETAYVAGVYSRLRRLTCVLNSLTIQSSTNEGLPPQEDCQAWMESMTRLLLTVVQGLEQFSTVLQSCPESTSATDICMSPLKQSLLPLAAGMKKGDEKWKEIVDLAEESLKKAKQAFSGVKSLGGNQLFFWSDLKVLSSELTTITETVPKIKSLARQFDDAVGENSTCLNDVLYFLCEEINEKCTKFNDWQKSLPPSNDPASSPSSSLKVQAFAESIETFLGTILLAIQKVTKKMNSKTETVEGANMQGDEGGPLKDKHLTDSLHTSLKEDLTCLNCLKVTDQLYDLVSDVRSMYSTSSASMEGSSLVCLQLLTQCLPMVHQYSAVVEFYLSQIVATHRGTGKLLSVLLKVFTELALKGFCLPAEFAGDMEGGGSTQFEDIEGGGLGEGEGAKDVSDQIETEDQLHDAEKAGEQKQEDASDQPDVPSEDNAIEMSEDFEGKMHDLEQAEGEEDEDDADNEEDKLDKQMGDVDDASADKLDEQMWGSDEEDNPEEKESKEESGPGDGKQSESELVAKDDNPDKSERDGAKDMQSDSEEKEEHKPHDLEQLDENEYDDDKVDPHSNKAPEEPPDGLDLPDDLNLDEDESHETGEDSQATEPDVDEQASQDLGKHAEAEEVEDKSDDGKGDNCENEKGDNSEDKPNEDSEEGKEQDMETETGAEATENPTDETPEDNEEGKHEEGINAQDNPDEDIPHKDTLQAEEVQTAEEHGQTSHGVEDTEQADTAKDRAGTSENNKDESDGTGQSVSELSDGHEGQTSTRVTHGGSGQENKQKQKRKPGVSDSRRSLGSVEEKYKRLMTQDRATDQRDDGQDNQEEADLFEHVKDTQSRSDMQTLDVATSEQQEEQPMPNMDMEEAEPMEEDEAEAMKPDDTQEENKEQEVVKDLKPTRLKSQKAEEGKEKGENSDEDGKGQQYDTSGELVLTMTVERGPETTIHTALQHLSIEESSLDVEKLRSELEERLAEWQQPQTLHTSEEAMEAWFRYEAITSSLSQELCEQLRLVLEPTQATKLKGDYRTGKRLNMRKVIPYIASEFRKDKIWLRRTKPSKRDYQILVAMDDSSSMTDNHSKQLAFESLAVISNALSLLEAGQLGICSFGESVQVLHPFTEQFTSQSGARILQQFTFEQKKTKIAQLLKEVTGVMLEARSKHPGSASRSETAQLLLVVSDGRGLFLEGMDVVKSAVRQARAANIFLVFVVIDNPQCKDSILDIKVPLFKGPGLLPEIQSYMDHFPFPFYLILRDINSLPSTLSDALRQWFELVTAIDR